MSEPRKRSVGSAAVIDDGRVGTGRRILMGIRNKDPNRGRWVLPGGKPQGIETLQEAVKREFLEETGKAIYLTGFLGIWEVSDGEDWLVAVHAGLAASDRNPVQQSGSDLLRPRWVDQQYLPQLDITPVCVSILRDTGWLP